jgi:hypothetical protein
MRQIGVSYIIQQFLQVHISTNHRAERDAEYQVHIEKYLILKINYNYPKKWSFHILVYDLYFIAESSICTEFFVNS